MRRTPCPAGAAEGGGDGDERLSRSGAGGARGGGWAAASWPPAARAGPRGGVGLAAMHCQDSRHAGGGVARRAASGPPPPRRPAAPPPPRRWRLRWSACGRGRPPTWAPRAAPRHGPPPLAGCGWPLGLRGRLQRPTMGGGVADGGNARPASHPSSQDLVSVSCEQILGRGPRGGATQSARLRSMAAVDTAITRRRAQAHKLLY